MGSHSEVFWNRGQIIHSNSIFMYLPFYGGTSILGNIQIVLCWSMLLPFECLCWWLGYPVMVGVPGWLWKLPFDPLLAEPAPPLCTTPAGPCDPSGSAGVASAASARHQRPSHGDLWKGYYAYYGTIYYSTFLTIIQISIYMYLKWWITLNNYDPFILCIVNYLMNYEYTRLVACSYLS